MKNNDKNKQLCNEGDKLFKITRKGIVEVTIKEINHYTYSYGAGGHYAYKDDTNNHYLARAFGVTLFTTKEEAEAYLSRKQYIATKRKLLQEYERQLNEEFNLTDHFIIK